MDSNTLEESSQASTSSIDEDVQMSYRFRMECAQNFDDEEIITISSESEKSNVENEPDFNTRSQQISSDSDISKHGDQNVPNVSTQPLSSDSDGNETNLNKCQKLFASETQSSSYKRKTPELFDSGDDTETELRNSDSSENECLTQKIPSRKCLKTNINLMDEAANHHR